MTNFERVSRGMELLYSGLMPYFAREMKAEQGEDWDVEAEQGLFTKHLLLALNGKADLKKYGGNKDGRVSLKELKEYLDDEMTYQATTMNRRQNADISGNLQTVLSTY